jgi:hypothetical protein
MTSGPVFVHDRQPEAAAGAPPCSSFHSLFRGVKRATIRRLASAIIASSLLSNQTPHFRIASGGTAVVWRWLAASHSSPLSCSCYPDSHHPHAQRVSSSQRIVAARRVSGVTEEAGGTGTEEAVGRLRGPTSSSPSTRCRVAHPHEGIRAGVLCPPPPPAPGPATVFLHGWKEAAQRGS